MGNSIGSWKRIMNKKSKNKKLSIVIVCWNCWDYLNRCLESIEKNIGEISYEIIIVDNNSSDDTVINLKTFFPDIKLIESKENLGFARGNNCGVNSSSGDYILVLNPDTEIFPETIAEAIRFLDNNQEYGCVGVKHYRDNGRIDNHSARRFLTLSRAINEYFFLDKLFLNYGLFKGTYLSEKELSFDRDVDAVSGAFMLFRREAFFSVSGFCEDLLLYFDDLEICRKLWSKGYKVRYLSKPSIIHYRNKSSNKANQRLISLLGLEANYLSIKSNQGKFYADLYKILIFLFSPIKLILIPFISIGYYYRNRQLIFKKQVISFITIFEWVFFGYNKIK